MVNFLSQRRKEAVAERSAAITALRASCADWVKNALEQNMVVAEVLDDIDPSLFSTHLAGMLGRSSVMYGAMLGILDIGSDDDVLLIARSIMEAGGES